MSSSGGDSAAPAEGAPPSEPRFLVVGCGAIGGVVTAALAEAGRSVAATTTNRAIYEAIASRGLEIVGDGPSRRVRADVFLGSGPGSTFDYIILATQPPQVERAAEEVLPLLAPGGAMVVLQNGLCEERLARIAGADRVVGAVVAWGATMHAPGVYERTADGGFAVGALDDRPWSGARDALVFALEAVGPVDTTTNLRGKRWSKLAINCAISSLGTLGGDRLGALLPHRFVRRLALEIMTEVVAVARAEGVRLEKVSGTVDLAWLALTEAEKAAARAPSLVAKHGVLLAVGLRYRRMRSSMLAAIERGRTPAVDFLNGEIVTRGGARGIDVPINARVRDTVWAIAAGKRAPSKELLRELYEETRAPASRGT